MGKLINPVKLTPALCSFTDIAGLVKGASKGEGLGNQFLNNIKEVDAICHVVRCFSDPTITHVMNDVDPIRDCEIINMELIIADLDAMEKRWSKIVSNAKSGKEEAIFEQSIVKKIINTLKNNQFVNINDYDEKEIIYVKQYNLLTTKPILYIANIDEAYIVNPHENANYQKFQQYINNKHAIIPLAIAMEYEISKLEDIDKQNFLNDLGIKQIGLDRLINATYNLLGTQTFFTFGADETKAWTFTKGMTAPQCAGIIHSDIEKGFIRAEIMKASDLITLGSELKVKESGKLRIEGKDYLMIDGDVAYFRFNISK
jgi:GTP-binding protein YchF